MKDCLYDLSHLVENQKETSPEGETVKIKGEIPGWVKGSIYTTGSGKFHFEESDFSVRHISDGYGIVCKFTFSRNEVTLLKKFEQSDALKKATAAGKTVLAELFTKSSADVTKNRVGRFLSLVPEISDNGNHGIFTLGNKIYTSNGLQHFREINKLDLSTGEKYDAKKLFGVTGLCPHPLRDEEGNWYNIGGSVSATGGKQMVIKIPAPNLEDEEGFREWAEHYKTLTTYGMPRLLYCNVHHSFAMTQNYIILIEQPYVINVKKMIGWVLSGSSSCYSDVSEWQPHIPNRFVIIDKKTGEVQERNIVSDKSFFLLHFVNSFESDSEIIVDVVTYSDTSCLDLMFLEKFKTGKCCTTQIDGSLRRFAIPLSNDGDTNYLEHKKYFGANATVKDNDDIILTPGILSKFGVQTVGFNPKMKNRKYRFLYINPGCHMTGQYGKSIVKLDLETGTETEWNAGGDYMFGEATFINSPEGETEDDGVLIVSVYSAHRHEKPFLVILCTKTMTELGRAQFQNIIPVYAHSVYLSTTE